MPKWKFIVKEIDGYSLRIVILSDESLLTFREIVTLWKNDPSFVECYRQEILQAG